MSKNKMLVSKINNKGVPILPQQIKNMTGIHEIVGLIPGLG